MGNPSTPNRGYVYPAEYTGDWFTIFAALMNAIDADVAAALASKNGLTVNTVNPFLRLAGLEAGAGDFQFIETGGILYLQKNVGTFGSPVWISILAFTQAGDIQFLVNNKGPAIADANGVYRRVGFDTDGAIGSIAYP